MYDMYLGNGVLGGSKIDADKWMMSRWSDSGRYRWRRMVILM